MRGARRLWRGRVRRAHGDGRGHGRPVPQARARRGPAQGIGVHAAGGRTAAQLDHDQEGVRRAGRASRRRGGRHRRPLWSQPQGRVLPHFDRGRLRDRVDRERVRAQQRVPQPLPGRGRDRGASPVPYPLPRTATTAASPSTRTSSATYRSSTWSRPGAGRTGRTTRPPSNPGTTTSCASTRSTTDTSRPSSTC